MIIIIPVRCDENAFSAIPLLAHRVPEVFPGGGVQAGSWLVQEQDARVTDHSYGCAEFPLVSTTISTKTNTTNSRLKSIRLNVNILNRVYQFISNVNFFLQKYKFIVCVFC